MTDRERLPSTPGGTPLNPPAVTPIERDPARLREALPWYRNGTLSAGDRAWVEARLAEDPAAGEEAAFDQLVQSELNAQVEQIPAGIGWEALLSRARADAASARATAPAMTSTTASTTTPAAAARAPLDGISERAGSALGADGAGQSGTPAVGRPAVGRPEAAATATTGSRGASAGPASNGGLGGLGDLLSRIVEAVGQFMTPRLATGLAALLIAQTVALGVLLGGRDGERNGGQAGGTDTVEYRSAPGAVPVATLRVLLNDQVPEATLRDALVARQVSIIDGPNDLGEYWLLPRQGDPEAVARALAAAGVVATWSVDHRPRVR